MKTYFVLAFLFLYSTISISQNKHPTATNDLPQNVINDFAKAVNYSWNYANNTDALKAALIPGLRERGVYSQVEIERTIQDVGKGKNYCDLVLGALSDYTGMGRLNQILLNMNIPANSAGVLTAYAYKLQQKSTTNKENVTLENNTSDEYIVTAQKAYFYTTATKTSTSHRTPVYLVEGERLVSIKENDGKVYCNFTNPTTKKTTSGWILKADLELYESGGQQINTIGANFPFYLLKKFDGEHEDIKKVYADPIITGAVKTLTGSDYTAFNKDFLLTFIIGDVYVRHNVLYIRSWIAHNGTQNAYFFLDLTNGQSLLKWNTSDSNGDVLPKYFGKTPSQNIVNFIQSYLENMKEYVDDNDRSRLQEILNYKDKDDLTVVLDKEPEFPGGADAFNKFLSKNIKYPQLARLNNVQGKVYVEFVVETDGTLTNLKITKGLGSGCDEEVLRVMKLSPNWLPGSANGEVRRSTFTAPVNFTLSADY